MKSLSAILVSLALVTSATSAQALDYCFNDGVAGNPTIIVAKRYSRPLRGGCKPLTGFKLDGPLTTNLVSGTACLNAAGDTLRVAYTIHPEVDGFSHSPTVWGQMDLAYPSLATGKSAQQVQTTPGSYSGSTAAFGGPCFFPVPIP